MAFTVIAGAWSDEGYKDHTLDKAGTGAAISAVTADGARGDKSGEVTSVGGWRVDRQNPTPTHANLQVQRNGKFPSGTKTSVGGLKIPKALLASLPTKVQTAQEIARHKELTRAMQSGLSQSVGTWTIGGPAQDQYGRFRFYEVNGTFSS